MSVQSDSTSIPAFAQPETVADVVQAYLPTAKRELDAYDNRRRELEDFVRHFGTARIADCKPHFLQTWLDRHDGWKSNYTRARAVAGVHACFNWARRLGYIAANPFHGFRTPTGERGDVMEDYEYHQILRHARPDFRRLVVAMRYTGARPGELAKATLADVDYERCAIVLKKHKTSKKTGKPRVIVMHPTVLKYVRSDGPEVRSLRRS